MDGPEGPPTIPLPERLDRRLRFGPFPSARDGLKFVLYAAVGGALAPIASPLLWLPIVVAGFGLAVVKPDGEAIDERALALVLWQLRRRSGGPPVTSPPDGPGLRRGLLARAEGGYYAVIRVGGVPLAYLPPIELERRFERYRELLRSCDGSLAWTARAVPLAAGPVRPDLPTTEGEEATSAAGYRELVEKLCQRRFSRRVEVVLAALSTDPDHILRLEGRVARFAEGLTALGLSPIRLADRPLWEAGRRLGLGLRAERP
jgi:hypothetical protein